MWLENARMILPDRVLECGALHIADGVITEIREGGAPTQALDAQGMTLFPGLVDLHGDMIERELEPRPGTRFDHDLALLELDKRLASSGVTTAFASMSFADGLGLRSDSRALEIIQTLVDRRKVLLVDHRIHARYEVSNVDAQPQILALMEQGHLDLISLMDHTPGQGQYRDMETYVNYLAKWLGRNADHVRELAQERMNTDSGHVWSVGAELGKIACTRGIAVASHDDDTPEKVRLVQGMGATISEFPVTLEAAQEACRLGMQVFMGAPNALRGTSHSGNISALDALEAGVLHGLAADYSPMTMLQAAWRIASEQRRTWSEAAALVSTTPAKAAGLHDRGRLEVGLRADLVLVEAGHRPRVRLTLAGGRVIFHDGTLSEVKQPAGFF